MCDYKCVFASGPISYNRKIRPRSYVSAFGAQLMVSHTFGKYEGFHLKVAQSKPRVWKLWVLRMYTNYVTSAEKNGF